MDRFWTTLLDFSVEIINFCFESFMSLLRLEVKNLFFFYDEGSKLVKLKVGCSKMKSEVQKNYRKTREVPIKATRQVIYRF